MLRALEDQPELVLKDHSSQGPKKIDQKVCWKAIRSQGPRRPIKYYVKRSVVFRALEDPSKIGWEVFGLKTLYYPLKKKKKELTQQQIIIYKK